MHTRMHTCTHTYTHADIPRCIHIMYTQMHLYTHSLISFMNERSCDDHLLVWTEATFSSAVQESN